MKEDIKDKISSALNRLSNYIYESPDEEIQQFINGKDFYVKVLIDSPKDWSLDCTDEPDPKPIRFLTLRLRGEI